MTSLKRLSAYITGRSSFVVQSKPGIALPFAKTLSRLMVSIGVAAAFVFASPLIHVLGKTNQTREAIDSIDPDAIETLKKMSVYLRTLKSFQVIADETSDDVLDDGQIVQYMSKVDILAAKPSHFRIEVTSGEKHRLFLYDGKNFTVWGKLLNYYATVSAPPTIGKLIKQADEKYGIELPLTDLFTWGTDEEDAKKIRAAIDIGPSTVNGVTCEHYAFRQEGVDWQIWIQLGEFPLPRKLVITTLTDEARPQHSDTLTWNLAPSFSENAFTFTPPQDSRRIRLAEQPFSPTEIRR